MQATVSIQRNGATSGRVRPTSSRVDLSIRLADEQWAYVHPYIPPSSARTGRPRADDRRTLEGILYVLRTGCRWRDLPTDYGSPITCWRRLREWEENGAWEKIWLAVLATLDDLGRLHWLHALYSGSFVPTKAGHLRRSEAFPTRPATQAIDISDLSVQS